MLKYLARTFSIATTVAFALFVATWPLRADLLDGAMTAARSILPPNIQPSSTPYTPNRSDCFRPYIQVGTGTGGTTAAPPAITLPPAVDLPNGCVLTTKNGDTNRGKLLTSFPTDLYNILWPLQTVAVVNAGGVWNSTLNPGPYQLNGVTPSTLQTDHTSGVNANNDCLGTSAAACNTIQNAAGIFQSHVMCNGQQPFIQVNDSSFTENVSLNGVTCPGVNNLQIVGNPTTPDNVVWNANVSGTPGLNISDHATVIANGFKVQCSTSGAIDFQVNQGGTFGFENIDYANCGGGKHIVVAGNGILIYEGGTYTVSATTMGFHLVIAGACYFAPVGGQTVSTPNAMAFTDFYDLNNGFVNTTLLYSGTGSGAGSTGTKYAVSANGALLLNGTTLPGATGGGTSTGGQAFLWQPPFASNDNWQAMDGCNDNTSDLCKAM